MPNSTSATGTETDHREPQHIALRVAVSIAAGAAIGILLAIVVHYLSNEADSAGFSRTAFQQMLFFGGWGALVVPLWYLMGRLEHVPGVSARIASIVVAGVVTWMLHSAFLYLTASTSQTPRTLKGLQGYALRTIYIESIVYAAVASAIAGARHRLRALSHERKAAALAMQLSRAQLHALQAQVHPHFLFNALHTVSMLARAGDTPRVVEVTARLGDVLRAMLDSEEENEWTLGEELALAERYLAIELVRFGDRLEIGMHASDDVRKGMVPRFVLQPIIENAMHHGVAHKGAGGCIDIRGERNAGMLTLTVTDNGPGMSDMPAPLDARSRARPLGLHITRERLAMSYGSAASLVNSTRDGGGMVATINLPWHTSAAFISGAP